MAYCTNQDLIDRFGEGEILQLTDKQNLGVIDDTVLAQAVDDAAAEIDGYLAKFLPLTDVPKVLVRINAVIARYILYDDQATDQVEKQYEAALRVLTKIAESDLSLGQDSGGNLVEAENVAIVESVGRTFDRGDKSFI